jgi:hypothetical protein
MNKDNVIDFDLQCIYHPAHENRFMLRFVAESNALKNLSKQAISYSYDLVEKNIKVIFEIAGSANVVEEELLDFCSGSKKLAGHGNFIVIEFLSSTGLTPEKSIHCIVDNVISCKMKGDYAGSGTCKAELICNISNFKFS